MARESQEPKTYDLLPTDDVGQRVVRYWVLATTVRAGVVITPGVTLQAFIGTLGSEAHDVLDMGYGSYVLTAPGPAADGYVSFLFAAPGSAASTDLKHQTPYREQEIWVNDFTWPDVLRWLLASKSYEPVITETGSNASGATSNAQFRLEMLDQWELVPGGNLPTKVKVQDFLTPYVITGIQVMPMRPDVVRYRYLGMSNALSCLHPTVIVPGMLTSPQLVDAFGTANAEQVYADNAGGQTFPATFYETWPVHIYRVDQSPDPVDGAYKTRLWTAYPPPMPKGQTLAA